MSDPTKTRSRMPDVPEAAAAPDADATATARSRRRQCRRRRASRTGPPHWSPTPPAEAPPTMLVQEERVRTRLRRRPSAALTPQQTATTAQVIDLEGVRADERRPRWPTSPRCMSSARSPGAAILPPASSPGPLPSPRCARPCSRPAPPRTRPRPSAARSGRRLPNRPSPRSTPRRSTPPATTTPARNCAQAARSAVAQARIFDMPELQEGRYAGEFLVSEGNGRISREIITVLSGETLQATAILGKVTASGKYKVLDPAAVDGSEARRRRSSTTRSMPRPPIPRASPSCVWPRSTPPSWSGLTASPGVSRPPRSASSPRFPSSPADVRHFQVGQR